MPIRTVVIDHTEDSTIYLGAEIGVYKKLCLRTRGNYNNENLPKHNCYGT